MPKDERTTGQAGTRGFDWQSSQGKFQTRDVLDRLATQINSGQIFGPQAKADMRGDAINVRLGDHEFDLSIREGGNRPRT